MSEYQAACAFTVDSKKCLLELKIISSWQIPSVCAQIHQMEDGKLWLYWNLALKDTDYIIKLGDYYKSVYGPKVMKWSAGKVLELAKTDNGAWNYIKQLAPVHKKELSDDEIQLVNDVVNSNWGEPYKNPRCGLDGHRYYLKIYKEQLIEYETWCMIPEEWQELIPFVNFVVDNIAGYKNIKRHYRPMNNTEFNLDDVEPLDLPEWMKSDDGIYDKFGKNE